MQCDECRQEVPVESMFCPHCGARLDEAGTAVEPEVDDVDNAGGPQRLQAARAAAADKQPTEGELWAGTYSPKAMVGTAIAAAVVTILGAVAASFTGPVGWVVFAIGAILLWAAIAIMLLYRRITVRYRLTTFRFFHETGFLSRTRNRIEVIDINDVTLRQGILERMFDVGTIRIQSSDVTHPDLNLPGIENVKCVADLIDDTRRAERQRRGLFMENI